MGMVDKMRPLYNRVIVKIVETDENAKSKGGLLLPDSVRANINLQKGYVVAVGSGKVLDDGRVLPVPVKPGDLVFFARYAGFETKIEGETYQVMHDTDIFAYIPSEEAQGFEETLRDML